MDFVSAPNRLLQLLFAVAKLSDNAYCTNNSVDELSSLFQAISLYDFIHFHPIEGEKDVLTCSIADLQVDENNLIIKALDLMRRKTKINQYFRIHLDKKAPMQAGLGGGSGNAATAMYAFNKLTNAKGEQQTFKIYENLMKYCLWYQ